jgi:hypothetical protein
MLHYNPVDGRLYFFDNGKLLSVNVRSNEPDYYEEEEDDEDTAAAAAVQMSHQGGEGGEVNLASVRA